ncbi:MAG: hypothetical protein MZW92_64195 [Comamonadaceae bacterium]|nr:hypothetical protein [Comamonadaceae bacterium]
MSWKQLERVLASRIDAASRLVPVCRRRAAARRRRHRRRTRGSSCAACDDLLRKEHREDYCGIVYADDLRPADACVKIYDPNNLGVVLRLQQESAAAGLDHEPRCRRWT